MKIVFHPIKNMFSQNNAFCTIFWIIIAIVVILYGAFLYFVFGSLCLSEAPESCEQSFGKCICKKDYPYVYQMPDENCGDCIKGCKY